MGHLVYLSPHAPQSPIKMMNPDTIIPQLKAYFAQQPEVVLAYLYGSGATGRQHAHSDLDIGVLFDEPLSPDEQFHRALYHADKIDHLVHLGMEIDLRELNGQPLEFLYQVIKPRKCVHARSERERVQFEADTIIDYLDFKPVLDLYYGHMVKQLSEGNLLYGYEFRNRITTARQAAGATSSPGTASVADLAQVHR